GGEGALSTPAPLPLRGEGTQSRAAQAAPVREDVLYDVVVGRGAGEIAEAVGLEVAQGLGRRVVLVLHPIDRGHDPGAVQPGPAVDQDGVVGRVVHDGQEAVDGLRPLGGDLAARDDVGRQPDVAHAEAVAQLALGDVAAAEVVPGQFRVGVFVLEVDNGADA